MSEGETTIGAVLYPRLSLGRAASLTDGLSGQDVSELSLLVGPPDLSGTYFAPTGGHRVELPQLIRLAEQLREVAAQAGFPEPLASGDARRRGSTFDSHAAALLLEQMKITPAEAAKQGVWAFLSC